MFMWLGVHFGINGMWLSPELLSLWWWGWGCNLPLNASHIYILDTKCFSTLICFVDEHIMWCSLPYSPQTSTRETGIRKWLRTYLCTLTGVTMAMEGSSSTTIPSSSNLYCLILYLSPPYPYPKNHCLIVIYMALPILPDPDSPWMSCSPHTLPPSTIPHSPPQTASPMLSAPSSFFPFNYLIIIYDEPSPPAVVSPHPFSPRVIWLLSPQLPSLVDCYFLGRRAGGERSNAINATAHCRAPLLMLSLPPPHSLTALARLNVTSSWVAIVSWLLFLRLIWGGGDEIDGMGQVIVALHCLRSLPSSLPCENILHGYLCVFDLVFSHMMEFTVLNSQASFWRSLAEISLPFDFVRLN